MMKFGKLLRETSGAVSIAGALLFGTLLLLVGGVVDFGRAFLVQNDAQGALDASALAASDYDLSDAANLAGATEYAKRYFAVNFPANSWGSNIAAADLQVSATPTGPDSTVVSTALAGNASVKAYFLDGSITAPGTLSLSNDAEVSQKKIEVAKHFDINLGAVDMPASVCSDTQHWAVPVIDGRYTVHAIPYADFPSKFSPTGTKGQFAYQFINGFCRGIGVGVPGEPAPRLPEIDPAVNGMPREGLKVDFGGLKVVRATIGIRDLYVEDCFQTGSCGYKDVNVAPTYKKVEEKYCPPTSAPTYSAPIQQQYYGAEGPGAGG